MDIGAVQVLAQEERVGAQIARGGWIVEHGVKHLGTCHLVFVKEGLGQRVGCQPLEGIAQEDAAQGSATTLVTQDKAQSGDILYNILAIIHARIATRAQDAG